MSQKELAQKFFKAAKTKFGDKVLETFVSYDTPVVKIDHTIHRDFARWLKEDEEWKFNHFIDITAVDYMDKREKRFEVVVHVRSHELDFLIRFKTQVDGEDARIDSLVPVYVGALWSEREVFDLMGITFNDHPRMTRLLNPDDYVGHPLRKDFPVKGPHRGSFPRGTVISNKRREPVMTKETRPKPLDQLMPRTPLELKREPIRKEEEDRAKAGD